MALWETWSSRFSSIHSHTFPLPVSSWGPWDSGDRVQVGQGTRLRAAVGQGRAAVSEAPGAAHHGHKLCVCIHGGTEPAVVALELGQCDLWMGGP